jgi:hypothetical protein
MGLFKVVMIEIDVQKFSDLRIQFVRLRHLKCNVARAYCHSRLKSIAICTFVMAFSFINVYISNNCFASREKIIAFL